MGQVVLLAGAPVPLVVDLDDTLVRSGLRAECLLVQAKAHPAVVPALLPALLGGRAPWGRAIKPDAMPDVETLPYHEPLLDYLRAQQRLGRRVVLATAAPEAVAQAVARHLHLCETVLAAHGTRGPSGQRLQERLVARYGERGYDYAGRRRADLPVWSSARHAVLVGVDAALACDVEQLATVERVFAADGASAQTWLGAMRWKHWLKNLLVFLPWLAAGGPRRGLDGLLPACAAFVGFCLVASSVYVLNDLVDLPGDRRHPQKRQRALACGRLSIAQAAWLVAALWTAAAAVASRLPGGVGRTLAGYVVLMLVYTLRLKDLRIVDAMALGGGYSLRVVAGVAALQLDGSALLYGWCALMFGGLALLKRRAELAASMESLGAKGHSRSYRPGDARMLDAAGQACAAVATLWLALQPLVDPRAGAASWALWTLCLLLWAWTQHMWRMARLAHIRTDPVDFALHDACSRVAAALMLLLLWVVA